MNPNSRFCSLTPACLLACGLMLMLTAPASAQTQHPHDADALTTPASPQPASTLQGDTPSTLPLRILELHYQPPPGGMIPGNPDAEYIQLVNIGSQPIELAGVTFTSGVQFTFPSRTLPSGATVYVVLDRAAFEEEYGPAPNIAGQFSADRLADEGERIVLQDARGHTIHDFTYSNTWIPVTGGGGPALQIIDPFDPDRNHWSSQRHWRAAAPTLYRAAARGWELYQ